MTTEAPAAPATNPHQPALTEDGHNLRCTAPDCGYALHVYHHPSGNTPPEYWAGLFHSYHSRQYDPGNAPDIAVDWEISASCSVCPDGIGDVKTNDSETVRCEECGTTWHIDGTGGERAEADQ